MHVRHAVRQGSELIADLHQADSALFLCDDVFTLLRSFVRIEVLKLLCGDKENILWKDFLDKIILDGHVGLGLAQCLVYGTNDLLECIEIAFTLDNEPSAVPGNPVFPARPLLPSIR